MPVVVGVPESTPPTNVSPGGSVPLDDQVIEPVSPVWVKVWLTAVPTVIPPNVPGLKLVVGQVIVTLLYDVDPVQLLLPVTVTVKLYVPVVVGVPVSAPVVEFNVRPGGKEPVLIVNVGVPDAPDCVIVWL